MNIKSRLKKLEQQIIGNNSEFCGCLKETVFKIVPFGESEKRDETTYCETCCKPMASLNATFSFYKNIEVNDIEPKTKFSREEFEEWQNKHIVSEHISYEQYLVGNEKNADEH
jgi:hypothetical protein